MSSPVSLTNVFSVSHRGDRAVGTAMALLLSTPFVDTLVIGRRKAAGLSAYGVVVAVGLSAAAVAIAFTLVLVPADRSRAGPGWVAQILAAIIGAGFVIALQIAAILSYGTLSRFAILTSECRGSLGARRRQYRLVAGARDAW